MQLLPIVELESQGKATKGRWYGFGARVIHVDGGVRQYFMGGIYETEYVKENGK